MMGRQDYRDESVLKLKSKDREVKVKEQESSYQS